MSSDPIIGKLDEAIDLIDKIEGFISKLAPNKEVSPGIIFQIYQSLVLLREKIIEVRVEVLEKCSE
ncbi:MAG: hypothetical protein B6U89_04715 [Desulfurococcales archaeon ex4484_58]|nr:MAG: hypothetical protein B6U89_04715 [Desulfurococcales archaeon ex4484_58]